MGADDVDDIAAELYVLPPDEFTAARNARATGPHARSVKALRKPTVAAWAVNLLVHDGQLAEAVELSAALRDAQDDLDAAELAKLGRQRRALVAALAGEAVRLAERAATAVSAAARDDIEKTINAAIMDAAAASAVLTGRLVKPLEAGAIGDLAGAVGGSLAGVPQPAPRDDLAERRARKAAEKAAREAERLAGEADRELRRAAAQREKAQERVDHLSERIEDLRRDLHRLEADAEAADEQLRLRDAEHAAAAEQARAAEKKADAAREALT
ncbi:transposase [Microbacterium sp. NPDC055910]|uniref:transposase n=1 Tax=Microbacterium sp. NPDC055910 TaxID=3345659 RepID=UPI0035D59376